MDQTNSSTRLKIIRVEKASPEKFASARTAALLFLKAKLKQQNIDNQPTVVDENNMKKL